MFGIILGFQTLTCKKTGQLVTEKPLSVNSNFLKCHKVLLTTKDFYPDIVLGKNGQGFDPQRRSQVSFTVHGKSQQLFHKYWKRCHFWVIFRLVQITKSNGVTPGKPWKSVIIIIIAFIYLKKNLFINMSSRTKVWTRLRSALTKHSKTSI